MGTDTRGVKISSKNTVADANISDNIYIPIIRQVGASYENEKMQLNQIGSYGVGYNYFINGKMNIWQRGTSFAAIATGAYSADRIKYVKSGAMVHTVSRDASVPSAKYNYSFKLDVTTADASIDATDICAIQTHIEGYDFTDFVGESATLGFWVNYPRTGINCVSFSNGVDRSYIAEFTVNQAGVWEYKTVNVTFDYSGGTWNYTTGTGIRIAFCMAAGTNYITTKDSWQNGNYYATSYQVNNVLNTAYNCYITGITFNVGSKPYNNYNNNHLLDLLRCKRYYDTFGSGWGGRWNSTSSCSIYSVFQVIKRAAPSITVTNQTWTGGRVGIANVGNSVLSIASSNITDRGGIVTLTVDPTGASTGDFCIFYSNNFAADAEL